MEKNSEIQKFEILVIGDPHFKIKNSLDTDQLHQKLENLLKQKTYKFIVLLGDVLDRFETCHLDPMCRVINFLNMLRTYSTLYTLIGNHDRKNNKDFLSEIHPLTSCKMWNNTYIIDKTLSQIIEGFKFTFVPYVYPGKFMEALKSQEDPKFDPLESDVIFAHQEFLGCNLGIKKSEEGDIWEENYPLVISGHIHDYQKLAENLIYVGTPYQINFGEPHHKAVSEFIFFNNPFKYEEKRINLGIKTKTILKIEAQNIMNEKIPENTVCKIQLIAEHSSIMQHQKVQEWLSLGHEVKFMRKKERKIITDNFKFKNYRQILEENLKKFPELNALYFEIFSSIK